MQMECKNVKTREAVAFGKRDQGEMTETPPCAGTDFVVQPTEDYIPSTFIRGNTGS